MTVLILGNRISVVGTRKDTLLPKQVPIVDGSNYRKPLTMSIH